MPGICGIDLAKKLIQISSRLKLVNVVHPITKKYFSNRILCFMERHDLGYFIIIDLFKNVIRIKFYECRKTMID